jgi:hypothetical protein
LRLNVFTTDPNVNKTTLQESKGGPVTQWILLQNKVACSIGSRLYWYRGVTVLLPGWVIWKKM